LLLWERWSKNNLVVNINDFVSLVDFAPKQFLELAVLNQSDSQMQPNWRRSFNDILYSDSGKIYREDRDFVLIGKGDIDVGNQIDWDNPIENSKGRFIYFT